MTDAPPRILLLMTTQTYRARPFLQAARQLGVAVTVGADARSPLAKLTPGATLALDLDHPAMAARQIARFAADYPIAAIVGIDEATTIAAAVASAELGLPANTVESVVATRDKLRMRELLAGAGIPSPAFRAVPLTADPLRIAADLAFPVVVKPIALSASRGVIRADEPRQFAIAFRRAAAIARQAGGLPDESRAATHLLIEEYIPGVEVAVEGLLIDGRLVVLAIFDKPDPLEGPYFEETIYVTPSRLSADDQAAIAASAGAAAAAVGLWTGPVHAEIRWNDRGAWPIEIAARSIGGLCATTLRFGTGLSLEELILRQAIGADVTDARREDRAAGVMMLPIPRAGILRGVDGRAAALAVPGIEDLAITIPLGQRLVPLPEGSQYLGFLFARGEDPAEVEAALRAAHACLDFRVDPDTEG